MPLSARISSARVESPTLKAYPAAGWASKRKRSFTPFIGRQVISTSACVPDSGLSTPEQHMTNSRHTISASEFLLAFRLAIARTPATRTPSLAAPNEVSSACTHSNSPRASRSWIGQPPTGGVA